VQLVLMISVFCRLEKLPPDRVEILALRLAQALLSVVLGIFVMRIVPNFLLRQPSEIENFIKFSFVAHA
jgi:hypothetical protein